MALERCVISYVATFLPQEMLHVYRQVKALRRYKTCVVTRRRRHEERFPFDPVIELHKPWYRGMKRLVNKVKGERVELSDAEVDQLLDVREKLPGQLVHIYLGNEALRALPYLRRETAPRIVSFHGADLSSSFTREQFEKLEPYVRFFLCRSESLAHELTRRGCPRDRIRLNPTGVPLPENSARSFYDAKGSRPLCLLQASRFIAKKGLDATVESVRLLRDTGIPAKLTLAGDGPLADELKQQCANLGIGEHVDFTGFLGFDRLQELYRTHDIFLHPSRVSEKGDREGIPNSLLEAMAHGMPAIATRHSGIPEAVDHGKDGWLIEGASGKAIADAVTSIIDEPGKLASLSANARAKVADRFSTQRCGETLERIYDEVLEG